MSNSEDTLYHYGIPGMKWGVRHDKAARKDYRNAVKIAKQQRRQMSPVVKKISRQQRERTNYAPSEVGGRRKAEFLNKQGDIKNRANRNKKVAAIGGTLGTAVATTLVIASGGTAALPIAGITLASGTGMTLSEMGISELRSRSAEKYIKIGHNLAERTFKTAGYR